MDEDDKKTIDDLEESYKKSIEPKLEVENTTQYEVVPDPPEKQ